MLRKLLVADDSGLNRAILRTILSDGYQICEAQDGQAALDLLAREGERLSAVLLDVVMPVPDGHEVLARMQRDPLLSKIPVIVTTGSTDEAAEIKALSLGAADFITKPYNPEIVRRRVQNLINLRETAAMVNALQADELTGLPTRRAFFETAAAMIAAREPGYYTLSCFDIDNFKVINDQYGADKGDEVLRRVAGLLREGFAPAGGVCSRINADHFALLAPRAFVESLRIEQLHQALAHPDDTIPPISLSIGRYVVDDMTLPVSAMYDRASMARASVKGRYDTHIALYDESMRRRLLHQQEIVDEMRPALAAGQFEVWFQPQYNHESGACIGAEALVRWRHPQRGLIPPGDFIPVFERNGFIYELDKNVWEQTCLYLRRELDRGRTPMPISVNLSRRDIFRDDLIDVLTGLVARYRLPTELLRLEITESAFVGSAVQIVSVARRLVSLGFTVEIDDFGSGYSSLNTLKDVPAQILKLDMRFLETAVCELHGSCAESSSRGGNILESIVRMAKWLGMSVIAEGVETKAQADYLRSIGCRYIQGYYYARPMPMDEYRALPAAMGERKLAGLETVAHLNNNDFWNPDSIDTLIFNSFVGCACILEYACGRIELLRATDKYARLIGGAGVTIEDALKINWADHLDEAGRQAVGEAVRRSLVSGEEQTVEAAFHGLPGAAGLRYIRAGLRVIATVGQSHLLYCTNEDITAQRQAERREHLSSQRMRALMDSAVSVLPGVFFWHYDLQSRTLSFGDYQHGASFGYPETLRPMPERMLERGDVHPDDAPAFRQMYDALHGGAARCECVVRLRDHNTGAYDYYHTVCTRLPGSEADTQQAVGFAARVARPEGEGDAAQAR